MVCGLEKVRAPRPVADHAAYAAIRLRLTMKEKSRVASTRSVCPMVTSPCHTQMSVVSARLRRVTQTDGLDFLRKEVIQPQVPLRLPCYDLVPITKLAFGAALLAVGLTTSGALSFRGLTGGVYKAQEHIHRGVADPRLLAIPTSCRRVAAYNPN